MNSLFLRRSILVILLHSLVSVLGPTALVYGQEQYPKAVEIVAPDGLSTRIYSQPSRTSEILDFAFNGSIHEVLGTKDDFVAINLPDAGVTGYVLKEHTRPWKAPQEKGISPTVVILIVALVAIAAVAGIVVFVTKARKAKVAEVRAASIPASIKRAEELFREGDYSRALKEFRSFLDLHGGEVRNPDVYRRLSVCYQKLGEFREAAKAWEKMRSLGGLRDREDHTLGVALMMALGKEAEAALIYEELLETEDDDDTRMEIHAKLFHTYRRLKESAKLLKHAVHLMESEVGGETVFNDTVGYLVTERQTDLAVRSDNKALIKGICEELLEMKATTPEAARVYLKALEYDRTDKRLHAILSQIYNEGGDYRRAVSELIILHQLDRGQSDEYMAQAARIYVENSKVQEALTEGNPIVIKKIAQIYLARSEVNPDAVAVYEKVLEFQPKAVGINKMLSTVYLTKGDLNAYMQRLRVLHEIDGRNYDYLSDLARCIIDNDLVEQTIKEGNRDLNSRILRQLIKRGASDDQAVALFEKLIRVEPGNAPLRGALIHAYGQRGEHAKLLEHMLSLIPLKPEDKELPQKAVDLAVTRDLLQIIAESGGNKIVYLTALKLAEDKADNLHARQILEKALKQNPTDAVISSYLKSLKPIQGQAPPPSHSSEAPVAKPAPPKPVSGPPQPPNVAVRENRTSRDGDEPKTANADGPVTLGHARRPTQQRPGRKPLILPAERSTQVSSTERDPIKPESPREPSKLTAPRREVDKSVSEVPSQTIESQSPSPPHPERQELSFEPRKQEEQFVNLTSNDISFDEKVVTTFVSGYAKSLAAQFKREELYLPATGGFAYKDLEVLSTDGWGQIHVGVEVNTGRTVLLRVFRKTLLEFPLIKDFVQQITEIGFNIVHNSVLPVHEPVTGPGGVYGLVHPPYPTNVEMKMGSDKPLELGKALEIFGKILEGLSYAHSFKGLDGKLRRTFHLHMHPSQVLISADLSECRIVNLGYSQVFRNLTRAARPRWQEPGMNPATMPPEFFRSRSVGIRERSSEVYSLGALLYFMVTGEFPFEGPTFDDFKFQHTRIIATPPRLSNPDLPEWLDQVILGCLEKDPENRWGSMTELQREFNQGLKSGISA